MNADLMTVEQVAEYFGVSPSTVRRRLKERRDGQGTFPIPVFGFSKIARWKRSDIEGWSEIEPEIIAVETSTQRNHRVESARKGLAGLGIKVSKVR